MLTDEEIFNEARRRVIAHYQVKYTSQTLDISSDLSTRAIQIVEEIAH